MRKLPKIGLATAIAVVFTLLVGTLATMIIAVNATSTSDVLVRSADRVVIAAEREIDLTIRHRVEPVQAMARQWALGMAGRARTWNAREVFLPAMRAALEAHPQVTAIQFGYDNGDYFIIRAPNSDQVLETLQAPNGTAYVIDELTLSIFGTGLGIRVFQDANGEELGRIRLRDIAYDPRNRPWYQAALASGDITTTQPHVFKFMQTPGITVATPIQAGNGVVGLDIALDELGELLAMADIAPSQELAVIDANGTVLAFNRNDSFLRRVADGDLRLAHLSQLDASAINQLVTAPDQAPPDMVFGEETRQIGGIEWMTSAHPVVSIDWLEMMLVLAVPKHEVLAEARAAMQRTLSMIAGAIVVILPFLWLAADLVTQPLRRLRNETAAIQRFDMSGNDPRGSIFKEVDELAVTTRLMRRTLGEFMDLTTSIASEGDSDRIVQRVASESLTVSQAKVAAVLLVSEDGKSITIPHTLIAHPGSQPIEYAPPGIIALDDRSLAQVRPGEPSKCAKRSFAEGAIRTFSVSRSSADALGTHLLDAIGRADACVSSISLTNPQGVWLGNILVVKDPMNQKDQEREASTPRMRFCEALAQLVAIAMEGQSLLERQKSLLDAVIEMIASAVDAKSPYTGGHCRRVPDLALRLTKAAAESTDPAFETFEPTPADWETMRIAAWLHDCGKITTPEYVVDKATKLETITNRIHEIRTRFEIAKRDAEIAYWRAEARARGTLPDGVLVEFDPPVDWGAVKQRQARLDDDFAFVARCNTGEETMDDRAIDRLKSVGKRRWLRTLDNRRGLSIAETRALDGVAVEPLPAEESLLMDRPEHRVPRDDASLAAANDNPWQFQLDLPKHLMDKGEIHNLSIRKGTLTEEERAIINDHVVQSIVMLSQLPFPKELARVPEIAGAHHEQINGSGYPKKLTGEQMGMPERVLAIADVFEALTAADRPYRPTKTLSEALKILAFMVKDQHVDGDLFRLFLTSGTCEAYARDNLRADQLDRIDPDTLLALAGLQDPLGSHLQHVAAE